MTPVRPLRWPAALACGWLLLPPHNMAQAAAPAAQPEPEFVYRIQPRDTLIGLSRRLLLQPRRWPELQSRNRIANPNNIPPDTPLRIPYAWLKLRPDTAQVLAVAGTVTRGGVPVAQGEVLPEGTVIETGADGSATLAFADGSVATLQKSSVLRLEHLKQVEGVTDGHSAGLRLETGRIETTVKPRRDVGRFEIITPVAVSAVRGTKFRNSFDAAGGDARTETLEGTVGVAAQADAVAVGAGFGTRVQASGAVLPPVALLAAPDLSQLPPTNTVPALQVQFPPVPGAVRYRVQLASDAEFQSISFDAESTAPAASIPAMTDGAHWLRARAIDGFGIEGSDAVRQLAQNLLPAAPAQLAPQADARILGTAGSYEWAEVPGATRYRLQLARDAQFTQVVTERDVTGATKLAIEELQAGRYFWRTAAFNARDQMGPWSAPQSHVQRPRPVAIEPAVVRKREVRLQWPAGPGQAWRVQVARDGEFRQVFLDQRTDAAGLTLHKVRPGTYHARVQAIDAEGMEDPFGEPRRFDVELPLWLRIALPFTVLLPLVP